MKRCVIFGAGPVTDPDSLKGYLRDNDWYIAADGGIRLTAQLYITPHLMVADHDSSVPVYGIENIRLPREKDVTDTRAAMDIAFEKGYRDFLLLGCIGGRMDHTLACMLSAVQLTQKGANVQIIDGQNQMTVLSAGTHRLCNDFSKIFSVFALGETVKNLQILGVKYPLNGYDLECIDSLCVSNELASEDATISFGSGAVLLIFSKD